MAAENTRWRLPRADPGNSCAKEWIEENPFTSLTAVYGVGVAVGLLLGHTIAEAAGRRMFHRDSWTENLTGKIRDLVRSNVPKDVYQYFS